MEVKDIIEKYALTKEEAKGIEKMISMIMCLKKYEFLKRYNS